MTILNSFRFVVTLILLVSGSTLVFAQPGGTTDPSISGGGGQFVNATWKASKTPDGAYDRVPHMSQPIPWQHIREDDILWKKRVWREIDTREKQNVGFRYAGDENTGGGMFIEILLDGIKRGKIIAYNGFTDDRFTTVMSKDELMEQITGKTDTILQTDEVSGKEVQTIIHHDFDPEKITAYRIKEDWIFDRNEGKMIVRIVGLAPVRDVIVDGVYRGQQAMFWLYYPDIRNVLAQYEVYNPENDIVRYTWDEFFESRQFSSKITKVSNPFQQDFRSMPGETPMEILYQGQRATQEIFNKEHDMWVY